MEKCFEVNESFIHKKASLIYCCAFEMCTVNTISPRNLLFIRNIFSQKISADGTVQALGPVCTVVWPATGSQPELSYQDQIVDA